MNQTNQPTVAQSTPSASAQTSLAMGPALVAGLLGGLMASLTAISYASLVFSGPLAAYAAQGISLGIFSAMVLGLCLTWLGSFPGTIVIPQPRIAPLSLLVVSAATIPYGVQLSGDELFYTVLASLCIAAAFTGLVLLVLGIFKAGRFVRFVPYPVVGGFLAGAGWLLVAGAFKLMTSKPFGMEVAQASVGESLMVLVPGILLALTWILLLRRGAHYLASPTTLLGGMLLFYLVLFLVGGDLDSAFEQGLLLGPLPDGGGWSL
ncbi:MAG: SulP family inorganic anion transporter, partial [Gammaproteobacteria bacterium]